MSGNCGVVAICVTHPPWPWRVPRNVICSFIVNIGWQRTTEIFENKIQHNYKSISLDSNRKRLLPCWRITIYAQTAEK